MLELREARPTAMPATFPESRISADFMTLTVTPQTQDLAREYKNPPRIQCRCGKKQAGARPQKEKQKCPNRDLNSGSRLERPVSLAGLDDWGTAFFFSLHDRAPFGCTALQNLVGLQGKKNLDEKEKYLFKKKPFLAKRALSYGRTHDSI